MKAARTTIGVLLSLFVSFPGGQAYAAMSIAVTGSWYETVDKNDLVSGAGSDLQETFTNGAGLVSIDISGTSGPSDAWRVDIRKIDNTWDSSLHLYIMRTSDGAGGSVNGGTSFQEVSDSSATFFSGTGDVTGIEVQLRVTGVSVQIPPSSRSTEVYYTVVDTL